ncbi:hypothetical protein [Salsipaludibacter albus]|uniref:hypothetical protein n=1 Tax=Salsipaludibacter albus TaxID=2849650 RepID=UPI001EE438B7|nr:hypothetical protein [Salsipaludibacter albus]MBY5162743.1 hypothetical protein [Salsipaludibacter albus]
MDFLGDEVDPPEQAGHTTYALDVDPTIGMLWTYADRREGDVYERVGGGTYDPATDTWGQGAFNADDISRAAVVYLRHHELFGDDHSLEMARELLRGLTYLQTATGPNAGNVVLWMQPDGTLNPSAEPVELPDPSDSADSYWLARTIWALGEGWATFVDVDPDFADFLEDRLVLSVEAVERERLDESYGTTQVVDGLDWPAWLIADGADASSEAVLGLSAYLDAGGTDAGAATALRRLAEGIAMMQLGTTHDWPYRAIMPWAQSRTVWHAWGDQMAGALARASIVLGDADLRDVAVRETGSFTPHVLAQGGPENGWLPTPIDLTQIAYGADATLQNLLASGDATGRESFDELAGVAAAWYFGNNPAGEPMYDPATGRTYDGIDTGGTINRNSGAESTIHGLLSMIELDRRPEVATWARVATRTEHVTWQVVEAESAGDGPRAEVVTPESAWTGEGQWSGGANLQLDGRARVSLAVDLPTRDRQWLQPVFHRTTDDGQLLQVGMDTPRGRPIDTGGAGDQGVTPTEGYLAVEGRLSAPAGPGEATVALQTLRPKAEVAVDAVLVQPALEWLTLRDGSRAQVLLRSFDLHRRTRRVVVDGAEGVVATTFDSLGREVTSSTSDGDSIVAVVVPGGFTVVRSADG